MRKIFSKIRRLFCSTNSITQKVFKKATRSTTSLIQAVGSAVGGVLALIVVGGVVFVVALSAVVTEAFVPEREFNYAVQT